MYDVERFQNSKVKKYIEQVVEKFQIAGKNTDDTLKECLNIANFLANQKWQEMFSDLLEFKYMLKAFQVSHT